MIKRHLKHNEQIHDLMINALGFDQPNGYFREFEIFDNKYSVSKDTHLPMYVPITELEKAAPHLFGKRLKVLYEDDEGNDTEVHTPGIVIRSFVRQDPAHMNEETGEMVSSLIVTTYFSPYDLRYREYVALSEANHSIFTDFRYVHTGKGYDGGLCEIDFKNHISPWSLFVFKR